MEDNKYNNGIGASGGGANGTKTGLSPRKRKVSRRSNPEADRSNKILVALLAGAGAAFLLALAMLMSRLESDELSNGLMERGVGGTKGVDDTVYNEEASQGRAAMMQGKTAREKAKAKSKERKAAIMKKMGMMKKNMQRREDKMERKFGLGKNNPFQELTESLTGKLGQISNAMEGKGKMPKFSKESLHEDFHNIIMGHKHSEPRVERKYKKRGRGHIHQLDEKGEIVPYDVDDGGAGGGEEEVGINANDPPQFHPLFPPLPPHARAIDLFGRGIVDDVLSGEKPTIAGIVGLLQTFLTDLHGMLVKNKHSDQKPVIEAYFGLVNRILVPFEEAYRGRSIFPVREDGSIFISLGAYRDHLLGETLRQAFKTAANPEKLFVGAVVQNCFGLDGTVCRTGVEVKGKDKQGRAITKVSDKDADRNGIVEFCNDPEYTQYCDSGQIRALYVNETESNGPTTARYFASKLWGGETYFLQADAHLRFAKEWDDRYREEVKAARNYPKAVLSSYPPGFDESDPTYQGGSTGTRLCSCTFSDSDVEHKILRINIGGQCGAAKADAAHPFQVAFIAAGFFFARAEFLVDVPFDPFLPWCFMGEEIALSLRAWTSGWDIYAPRKNWIAHQYRPGRMGMPKFWENTGRVFGRPGPGFNTQLQTETIQRIKHMVGYKESDERRLIAEGYGTVLEDMEHYGPGTERTREDFLELMGINMDTEKCTLKPWCSHCELD